MRSEPGSELHALESTQAAAASLGIALDAAAVTPSFIQLKPESDDQIGAAAPVEQWAIAGAPPFRGGDRPLR
jgi:hypothetical protein